MSNSIKWLLYFIIGFSVLISVIAAHRYSYIEYEPAFQWIKDYFFLPIVILSISLGLAYVNALHGPYSQKRKLYFGIVLATGFIFILSITVFASILLSNEYAGEEQEIELHTVVTDYHESYRIRGRLFGKRLSRYIDISAPNLKRVVTFTVDEPYEKGDSFIMEMSVGRWGLLYKTE